MLTTLGPGRRTLLLVAPALLILAAALALDAPLQSLVAALQSEGGRKVMGWVTQLGAGWLDLLMAAALLAGAWLLRDRRALSAGGASLVAVALAGLVTQIGKGLVCRGRPWTDAAGIFFNSPCLNAGSALHSFPSGHAATAFALATALALAYPRIRWVFVAPAILVGISRIYLGAHFLSDVIAGAGVGAAAGWICSRLLRPRRDPDAPGLAR